jgi:hypothetical protein
MLKPLEVKTVNIATKAVTSDKIADNAIETRHIKNGAVTADKLTIMPAGRPLTPGLETSEIKDGAITSGKIAPNAVTTDHIASNAVANDDIKDGAISTAKIRDGAVTKEKMADGIIGTAEIIDGSITAAKLATNSVTNAKIATNAITKAKMADNSVGYAEIASQSLEPKGIKTISGLPATEGQIPVADLSQGNQWWFKWVTPGAAARPLTPPIATDEIGNAQVTQAKLAPDVQMGDRFVFLPMSVEAFYLAGQSASIDWTVADLSPWIPAGAKAALVQIGMFTESTTSGARADMRLRANEEQREALGITNKGPSQVDFNFGIVPITTVPTGRQAARTVDYRMDVNGVITVTFWITVIGYVI